MKSNGKFIITGEYSVMYAQLAIVAELQRSIKVDLLTVNKEVTKRNPYELEIFSIFAKKYKKNLDRLVTKVSSNLPAKAGLGSSASFAHAVFKTLAYKFAIEISKDELFELVLEAEKFIHGSPSGIDPAAVVYGGVIAFKKDPVKHSFHREFLKLPKAYQFLLLNSGQASESTGEMVSLFKRRLEQQPELREVVDRIGSISQKIYQQLISGSFTGSLIDENQRELEKLAVIGKKAKQMIEKVKQLGASVKLTGAGGVKTGSGWLLVFSHNLEPVRELARQESWEIIETKVE